MKDDLYIEMDPRFNFVYILYFWQLVWRLQGLKLSLWPILVIMDINEFKRRDFLKVNSKNFPAVFLQQLG